MTSELKGLRVAFLTANEGVEQVELTAPWQAVTDAGGTPELIAPESGDVQAFHHLDKADRFPVQHTFKDVDHTSYDAVVVPGGPNTLITSRKPDDLPTFCATLTQVFATQVQAA
jgi:protease I